MMAAKQPTKIIQAGGTAFNVIREPRGGKGLPGLAAVSVTNRSSISHRGEQGEAAQLDFTKWPRRFCCQQSSFLSVPKGFSFPMLSVLRLAAESAAGTTDWFSAVATPPPTHP